MQTLLIAIRSRPLCKLLRLDLSSHFSISSCHSGAEAHQMIDRLRPDALIIDLRLTDWNGLSVLEACAHRPSAIIALSDYMDEDVLQRLEAVGVAVLVMVPCTASCVTDLLLEITEKTPSPEL